MPLSRRNWVSEPSCLWTSSAASDEDGCVTIDGVNRHSVEGGSCPETEVDIGGVARQVGGIWRDRHHRQGVSSIGQNASGVVAHCQTADEKGSGLYVEFQSIRIVLQ